MVAGTVAHPSATPWSRDRAHLPAFRQTCFPIPLSEPAARVKRNGLSIDGLVYSVASERSNAESD
jgi:hypothetical protein